MAISHTALALFYRPFLPPSIFQSVSSCLTLLSVCLSPFVHLFCLPLSVSLSASVCLSRCVAPAPASLCNMSSTNAHRKYTWGQAPESPRRQPGTPRGELKQQRPLFLGQRAHHGPEPSPQHRRRFSREVRVSGIDREEKEFEIPRKHLKQMKHRVASGLEVRAFSAAVHCVFR